MNTYNVVVTVSTTVCIDAESPDDAIEKVSQALNNGDVNMSTDIANNIGYSMRNGHYEVTDAIPMGSTEAYTLSCATDILCNTPCPEANELFYNGYRWSCCPNDFELDDIIKYPEQYIVIPVLFAEQ